MADLNPLSLINSALSGLVSDTKSRMESESSDDILKSSGPNFTDVMMARVTARQNSPDDIKDIQKDYADNRPAADTKPEWVDHLKSARTSADLSVSDKTDRADEHSQSAAKSHAIKVRATVKADAKTADTADAAATVVVKESSTDDASATAADKAADTTAAGITATTEATAKMTVADDKAVKGLLTVANTLLQAEKDGKITLPPAIKTLLEKIAASDGTAAQIVPMVQDMLGALRKMETTLSADALKQPVGDMTWPAKIAALFDDLQVNPGIKTDQPVILGKVVKALRMLSHLVQQSAADLAKQQASAPIVPVINKPKKADATVATDVLPVAEKTKETLPVMDPAAAIMIDPALVAKAPVTMNLSAEVKAAMGDSSDRMDAKAPAAKPVMALDPDGPLDKTPHFDKAAAPSAPSARQASSAAIMANSAVPVFQQENNDTPALNPMAAALSARTVFTASSATPAGQTVSNIPHPATQQIVVALQKSPITKDTQLSLQLNPAELGRVDVKITIDQNGKASAQITADRAETLAMLQKDTSHLEKALQAAGLNSSAQDLHYSLREQNGQRNGQESGKRRRALFDADDEIKNVTLDTPIANDGLPHRVNYHA